MLTVDIGPAQASELNFVLSAWKRSAKDTPTNAQLPGRVYYARANPEIDQLVGRANVLVARDPEKRDFIYGWLAYETQPEALAVLWCYTRHAFRRQGVAKALLRHAVSASADTADLVFTSHSRFDWLAEQMGFSFENVYRWIRRGE